jgi:hypothetical protein
MKLVASIATRRHLLAGLAATLGLTAVAAPTIIAPVSAQPVEGSGPIQPNAISAPGTYEACTPYFGLMKDNADLLSFDVVNENNAVTPTPVIGTDIVPVLTVTDGTQGVECIPDLGWTDQATWQSDYVDAGTGFVISGLVAYPGTGYYLMPAVDGTTTFSLSDGGSILPTASSLRFEVNFTGRTVTVTPTNLVHTFGGYRPVENDLSSSQLADSYYAAVSQEVTTTGDAAQSAYLLQLMTAGSSNFCDQYTGEPLVPNQNYAPLIVTMNTLLQSSSFVVSNCLSIWHTTEYLYNAEVQKAKAPNSLVTLTITDPNATTTTTTTTSAAAEPVIPSFAG